MRRRCDHDPAHHGAVRLPAGPRAHAGQARRQALRQARAEETWIDGQRYFDLGTDTGLRESANRERQRLVAKALPIRQARMKMSRPGNGEGVAIPSSASPTPSSVSELMEYLAFQNWLHQSSHYRDGYWSGGQWHECTEVGR